jgi:hypothetical protein
MKNQPLLKTICLVLVCLVFLAPSPARVSLEYGYPDKISGYHHYIEGAIEGGGVVDKIHLQFVRNSQFSTFSQKKFLLREWGEKYQGSQMSLPEIGLPGPGDKVEKVIDRLGRVESVFRYSAGSRYYINWLVFTDHPMPVGSSWNYSYPLSFDVFGKTVKAECQMEYTLDKLLVYKKRHCAKILIHGNCSAQDPTTEFQYGFEGRSFFDLSQGREIDYQLNISWVKKDSAKNLKEIARIELYSILEK